MKLGNTKIGIFWLLLGMYIILLGFTLFIGMFAKVDGKGKCQEVIVRYNFRLELKECKS
jgi:hypothetical protein